MLLTYIIAIKGLIIYSAISFIIILIIMFIIIVKSY
jgi:hypothetical protein